LTPTAATTGQTINYAITTSSSNTAPTTGWQTGTTFNDLPANTAHYVWARVQQSTNYNAVSARSASITTANLNTLGTANFSITNTTQTYNGSGQGATVGYISSITPAQAGAITVYYNGSTTLPINAGAYTITVTTTGGTIYAAVTTPLTLGTLTINPAAGSAVSQPTVSTVTPPTQTSITVNTVTLNTATGQSIEYNISIQSNGNGLGNWQPGTTFNGLTLGTTYYVYARSVGNTNYTAGANNVSSGIATTNLTAPVASDFVVTNNSYTYNGSARSATVNYRTGITPAQAGAITVYYNGSTTPPINAGPYTITVTTAGGTTYSAITTPLNVGTLTINQANVTVPTPTARETNPTTIYLFSVEPSPDTEITGQTVEYALNTLLTEPTSGWQESSTFENRTPGTTYYAWARVLANTNYNSAISGRSEAITTDAASYSISASTTQLSFGISQIPYNQPLAQSVTITNTGNLTITLSQPSAVNYTITDFSPGNILSPGAIATINIRPNANLSADIYNTAITISGTGGASATVNTIFAVDRGTGAAVSAPAVSGTPTISSITVNAVTLTPATTGQTAEYAITSNQSPTLPTSGITWQASNTFDDLAPGTIYYIWARSAENQNYSAGTPTRSLDGFRTGRVVTVGPGNREPNFVAGAGYWNVTFNFTTTGFYTGNYYCIIDMQGLTAEAWVDITDDVKNNMAFNVYSTGGAGTYENITLTLEGVTSNSFRLVLP